MAGISTDSLSGEDLDFFQISLMNHLEVHQWLQKYYLTCKLKNLRLAPARNAPKYLRSQKGWSVRSNSTHAHSHQYHSHKQFLPLFLPSSQLRLPCEPNEPGSVVTTYAALISPCIPKVWTGIATITITDSLSLRLRKSIYCQQQPLRKMLVLKMENHPLRPLLCPLPITMT